VDPGLVDPNHYVTVLIHRGGEEFICPISCAGKAPGYTVRVEGAQILWAAVQ